jgi:hypothetical protein
VSCRLTLPIRQCSGSKGDIELGLRARMMRSFFRLDACSPCALIGALSVGALTAVASADCAAADDTPTTKAPASASPGSAYNWNGFYAGGQLGYAWGTSNWTASSPGAPNISGSFGLAQPVDIFSESGSFFGGCERELARIDRHYASVVPSPSAAWSAPEGQIATQPRDGLCDST